MPTWRLGYMFQERREAATFLASEAGRKAATDPCFGDVWADPAARVFIGRNPGEGWRKIDGDALAEELAAYKGR